MFDVTVIMPNYNHGHYLPKCLEAIYSQSVLPREVLVIDDGSTDESVAILNKLQKKYTTLKVLQNPKNLGIHESVNRGIFAAESTYLAFCSADDLVFPGFFEKCKEAFDLYPDAGLCFGDFAIFQTEEVHKEYRLLKRDKPLYLEPNAFSELIKENQFAINSYVAVCRKDYSQKVGGYKKELTCIADVYFCYQIAAQSPLVYVPHIFGSQRVVPETYSQKIRWSYTKRTKAWESFLEEALYREGIAFKKFVIESRLLGIGGYFILLFLLMHPKYWGLFPSVFLGVISRKLATNQSG